MKSLINANGLARAIKSLPEPKNAYEEIYRKVVAYVPMDYIIGDDEAAPANETLDCVTVCFVAYPYNYKGRQVLQWELILER
jgi:hypothetical protein